MNVYVACYLFYYMNAVDIGSLNNSNEHQRMNVSSHEDDALANIESSTG